MVQIEKQSNETIISDSMSKYRGKMNGNTIDAIRLYQTFMMGYFYGKGLLLKHVNYFCRKFHHRRLIKK